MLFGSAFLTAQTGAGTQDPGATLTINSRAVLVDVIVTDSHGNPIKGLKQDAFTITEQGKPQTIAFFEEHGAAPATAEPVQVPKLPPNVFSNSSPFPQPPAVTVLLLDSLNTRIQNQSYVHAQALKFLKTAKPGSRMAIFAMGLGLHFIQGFTDDPALLAKALDNKKNNEVESSVLLKGQAESNAEANVIAMMSAPQGNGATAASPGAIAALTRFFQENGDSRMVDRDLLTLENFQRLAIFLNSFPGRKNVIWFSEAFPLVVGGDFDQRLDTVTAKTMDMLAAARVALYPVDAGGATPLGIYEAGTQLPSTTHDPVSMLNTQNASRLGEDQERDANQTTMKRVAEETGGKAFVNGNGLAKIIGDVAGTSADFYSISYTPSNAKMDGTYRRIDLRVEGGKYRLSYRRGYIALADDLPGSGEMQRANAIHELAEKNPGAVDPLLPFMELGMPQSQQILFEAKIQPAPVGELSRPGDPKSVAARYGVDFAVDARDLRLPFTEEGSRSGTLNLSLIAYDRYGNVATRNDRIIQLHIRPEEWKQYQDSGVQLHAEIAVPKGNYWLRMGVFDQQSHKVGTMEVPLANVQTVQTATAVGATGPR
jgi:VWFA-related protein